MSIYSEDAKERARQQELNDYLAASVGQRSINRLIENLDNVDKTQGLPYVWDKARAAVEYKSKWTSRTTSPLGDGSTATLYTHPEEQGALQVGILADVLDARFDGDRLVAIAIPKDNKHLGHAIAIALGCEVIIVNGEDE